jgi:adenylate cyclase
MILLDFRRLDYGGLLGAKGKFHNFKSDLKDLLLWAHSWEYPHGDTLLWAPSQGQLYTQSYGVLIEME